MIIRNNAEAMIIAKMGLIPIGNIRIQGIKITKDEIASLIFNYGIYSFFINPRTDTIYGVQTEKIKRIGKLIVLEDNELGIER